MRRRLPVMLCVLPLVLLMAQAYTNIEANFAINVHDIAATNGPGGVIVPAGTVWVDDGGQTNFAIAPDAHYYITNVVVDGASVGATNGWTFANVTNGGHTIEAYFGIDQYMLTVVSPYGTPAPSGTTDS